MARPREFEIEDAERRLLEVFWRKGFEGASMRDIEQATRLKKQSLYRVFENKRGMYLAALAAYDQDHVAAARELLRQGPDALSAFTRLFEGVVDGAMESGDRRGCFLCNASVDQAPHDDQTSTQVGAMVARMEAAFADALQHDTQDESTVRRLARMLLAGYFGLRVLIKSGAEEQVLRDVVDELLANVARATPPV